MTSFEARFRSAGNDYDAALERTAGDTELLQQLMTMFLEDKSYESLCAAFDKEDCKEAFAAAHSLKGSSGMLGMDRLFAVAADITELLRSGSFEPAKKLFPKLQDEYMSVTDILRGLS